MKLSRDEQETHISQTAQERIDGFWEVYTDDPVMIRKFEKADAELIANMPHGGKKYRVRNNQISIRKPYKMTPARAKVLEKTSALLKSSS